MWLDLEMTGLDPEKEVIIEIATVVTNGDLKILAKGPQLVIHQSEEVLGSMDDWNRKHHQKSGLWNEVLCSRVTLEKAENETLQFVKKYCLPKTSPLCGNGIGHDRRFLFKYMPKLSAYLHYRNVDVSTIKSLVKRWYPRDKNVPKKKDKHRAYPDILESIDELRYYRAKYFK